MSGGTSAGADVHVLGVCPTPALAHVTGAGPYAAGIMVSASHNPADDNGLKVLDGRGLKLDESLEDELATLVMRVRRAGAPHATTGSAASSTPAPTWSATSSTAWPWPAPSARTCASTSTAPTARPARGPGHPGRQRRQRVRRALRRARRRQHQPGLRRHRPRRAGGDRRRARAATWASASTATPTAASPSTSAATVVDGDQLLGIIALDRLAREALAERHGRREHPLQRRPGAGRRGRRWPRPAHPGRRPLHPRLDARLRRRPGWREERPRHRPRAHHDRRRHRHGAGDPGHPGAHRPPALGAGGGHPARPPGAAHRARPPQGVARRPGPLRRP